MMNVMTYTRYAPYFLTLLLAQLAQAQVRVEGAENIGGSLRTAHDYHVAPDDSGFTHCQMQDHSMLEAPNLKSEYLTALRGQGIDAQDSSPKTVGARGTKIRLYLTEMSCGDQGEAKTISAPLMLFSRNKRSLISRASLVAEIIDISSGVLLKSIVTTVEGTGKAVRGTVYAFSTGTSMKEVTISILLKQLVKEAAILSAQELSKLGRAR